MKILNSDFVKSALKMSMRDKILDFWAREGATLRNLTLCSLAIVIFAILPRGTGVGRKASLSTQIHSQRSENEYGILDCICDYVD